jgi:hypothetical protein
LTSPAVDGLERLTNVADSSVGSPARRHDACCHLTGDLSTVSAASLHVPDGAGADNRVRPGHGSLTMGVDLAVVSLATPRQIATLAWCPSHLGGVLHGHEHAA